MLPKVRTCQGACSLGFRASRAQLSPRKPRYNQFETKPLILTTTESFLPFSLSSLVFIWLIPGSFSFFIKLFARLGVLSPLDCEDVPQS